MSQSSHEKVCCPVDGTRGAQTLVVVVGGRRDACCERAVRWRCQLRRAERAVRQMVPMSCVYGPCWAVSSRVLCDVPSVAMSGEVTGASVEAKSTLVARVIVSQKCLNAPYTCRLAHVHIPHTRAHSERRQRTRRRRRQRQRRSRRPCAHREDASRPCRAGSRPCTTCHAGGVCRDPLPTPQRVSRRGLSTCRRFDSRRPRRRRRGRRPASARRPWSTHGPERSCTRGARPPRPRATLEARESPAEGCAKASERSKERMCARGMGGGGSIATAQTAS